MEVDGSRRLSSVLVTTVAARHRYVMSGGDRIIFGWSSEILSYRSLISRGRETTTQEGSWGGERTTIIKVIVSGLQLQA